MTDKQDPIAHAARLLREAAEELRQAHTYHRSEGWQGETGAQSAYDVYMAAAQALEGWEEAIGAGGVQALQPEGAPPGSGGWQHHAETMERERDHWRERARTMEEHQRGTVWYWQGDGNDHPESMANSLPVVIRADQLRALIAGGAQALSAAPAGFVPVAAFDRLHAHAESLAARLLAAEQAAPKAAPVVWLSSKQLRGVTALHGQYLPFRCQPEGRFDTPVYLVEAAPKTAPQQEAQEPSFWMNEKGHTWSHSDWKQFPKHRAKYPIPLYPHFPAPQPAPACHHRPPCAECASLTAQGGK